MPPFSHVTSRSRPLGSWLVKFKIQNGANWREVPRPQRSPSRPLTPRNGRVLWFIDQMSRVSWRHFFNCAYRHSSEAAAVQSSQFLNCAAGTSRSYQLIDLLTLVPTDARRLDLWPPATVAFFDLLTRCLASVGAIFFNCAYRHCSEAAAVQSSQFLNCAAGTMPDEKHESKVQQMQHYFRIVMYILISFVSVSISITNIEFGFSSSMM